MITDRNSSAEFKYLRARRSHLLQCLGLKLAEEMRCTGNYYNDAWEGEKQ